MGAKGSSWNAKGGDCYTFTSASVYLGAIWKVVFVLGIIVSTMAEMSNAVAGNVVKDTTIAKNQPLRFEFKVPNINECGVRIQQSPTHALKSDISIDRNTRTVIYEYQPKLDYNGKDSFILVKGCLVNGDMSAIVADTFVYNVTIGEAPLKKSRRWFWFW